MPPVIESLEDRQAEMRERWSKKFNGVPVFYYVPEPEPIPIPRKCRDGKYTRIKDRRKAREDAAGPGYTKEEFKALCVEYGNACLRCHTSSEPLVPDHVIPLVRGGAHAIGNIQPLCWKCNLWKGTKSNEYRGVIEA